MGGDPASFEVDRVETNAPVEGGQTLEIAVELTNRGAYMDTKALVVEIDGLLTDSVPVVLVGGGSETKTFSVETTAEDAGEHVATISTEDDAVEEPVRVLEPTSVDVSVLELPSSVPAGEAVVATVEIANPADVERTVAVAFDADGIGSDSVAVSLEGGGETTETLSVETTPEDAGEHAVTVSAGSGETTETVTVTAEADEDEPAAEDSDRSADEDADGDDRSTPEDADRPTDEDADRSVDEDDESSAAGDDDRSAEGDDDSPADGSNEERMPGFGVGATAVGLGGVVHLLSRRLPGRDGDDR